MTAKPAQHRHPHNDTMQLVFWALWSLVGVFGTIAHATNVMEVDLVFPRNETYTTDQQMPVVFAIRNAQLGPLLQPSIEYQVRNRSDLGQTMPSHHHLFLNVSWTDYEPYYAYTFINMTAEGTFQIFWTTSWVFCNQTGDRNQIVRDHTTELLYFTIKKDAPATDLVAVTANDQLCNASPGISVNISSATAVPSSPEKGTCALMDPSNPIGVSSDPCRVNIDGSTAERIQNSLRERLCSALNADRPADCTTKENAAQSGAVVGIKCLAAAIVTVGFFLA
ncbi:hypothetical protein QBC36DRAFT_341371 [Triangularia setosa]|uniref:DUF7136 domain-containing protein n=1 Tax=Triangularia setosa TaxID=2587417 RepID=A0AAN6VY94_9PEZI|nr:hypothetical protein QBC36DRAFT_341371 [Podospora setosa]